MNKINKPRSKALPPLPFWGFLLGMFGLLVWQMTQIPVVALSKTGFSLHSVGALLFVGSLIFLFSTCFFKGRTMLGLCLALFLGSHPLVFKEVYQAWGLSGGVVTLTVLLTILYLPMYFRKQPFFLYPWAVAMITGALFAIFGMVCFEALIVMAGVLFALAFLYKGSLRKRAGLMMLILGYYWFGSYVIQTRNDKTFSDLRAYIHQAHEEHVASTSHQKEKWLSHLQSALPKVPQTPFRRETAEKQLKVAFNKMDSVTEDSITKTIVLAGDSYVEGLALFLSQPSNVWPHLTKSGQVSKASQEGSVRLGIGNWVREIPMPVFLIAGLVVFLIFTGRRSDLMVLTLFGSASLAVGLTSPGVGLVSVAAAAILFDRIVGVVLARQET